MKKLLCLFIFLFSHATFAADAIYTGFLAIKPLTAMTVLATSLQINHKKETLNLSSLIWMLIGILSLKKT